MRSLFSIALATIASSTTLWAGCSAEPEPPPLPEASSLSLADIGAEAPVTGSVDEQAFTALDVRFRVVRYAGRERVDLLFSDRAIERCGLPIDRPETLVWLRFAGEGPVAPGRYETPAREQRDPQEATGEGALVDRPLSVHWERPAGEGLEHTIRSSDRGVALVEVESATSENVRGTVHVCFASVDAPSAGSTDGAGPSCGRGRLDARPCWSRIDGRTAREPPGLVDQALEPRARAPAPLRPPRRYEPARRESVVEPDAGVPASTTPAPTTGARP